MTLHLMRLQPDSNALAAWSSRHGLTSPDGDFGYTLHALLAAAFGDIAPSPLRYLGGREGLLAYSSQDPESLRLNAMLAAPDVARALGLDTMDSRPFPDVWKTGQHLRFDVRVRPVVRTKDGRERDAYLHSLGERPNGAQEAAAPGADRVHIYGDWLAKQFAVDHAARIREAHMNAFRLTRVVRKGNRVDNGLRDAQLVNGPDVVFKGELIVGDSDAFSRLLARGIGRHRAFGFGMLLLRPASRC